MGKILAVDLGKKRIGLAISNSDKTIAFPLKKVPAGRTAEASAETILKEIELLGPIDVIVLGLPIHLSGHESEMSKYVRLFKECLAAKTSIPIQFIDERLTSKGAEADLRLTGKSRRHTKEEVDAVSAHFILQIYLDRNSI
ncbi:MAG: hypothetical protein A3F09_04870 [Chlamydiae bacterium RIFCSPHIGHO2_12_FULL_49_11]|nr:MAG: hypothetical protein A3F09_04870 [Chlamydiae bacterium RIFCSPHIGHO2_12_FULL_49_11]